MMKRMNKIAILAGAVAGMVLVGCVKEKNVFEPGAEIRFSASSSGLETRTVYDPSGATGGKHYINWVAGDGMTILMVPPSGSSTSRNYVVSTVDEVTGDVNSKSKATVGPNGGSALTWKTVGDYSFYAMYPAAANSSYPLKGTIPSTQAASTSLTYGYMYADPVQKSVEARKTVTDINLYFRPSFTAFHFTLKNSGSEAITLYSFELTSPTNALNGDIEYITGSTPTVSHKVGTGVTDSEKTITVSNITVPRKDGSTDGSIEFIITTLPNSYASLTAKIKTTADGSPKTLTMAPTGGFAATMKHNITMTLPSFASYDYTFEVVDPTDLADLDGTSSTAVVRSYKSNDGGTTKTPVSWEVEGYYDTAEHAATGGDEGSLNPEDYSWLTSSIQAASPLEAIQTVNFSYSTTPVTGISNLEAEINSNIAANVPAEGAPGSSQALAINLANSSHGTGSYITESANCYIVNGPGWYKIPIVMGNGVKGDQLNSDSYSYTGGGGGDDSKAPLFYDYDGTAISSPILTQPSSASIIWQDIDGLVSIPSSDAISSDTKGRYWLKFQIPEKKAAQGNAIIGVKNNSKIVMWSYHIWVTDQLPTNVTSLLGWVTTGGTYSKTPARNVYLRISQNEASSDKTPLVLSIEVPVGSASSQIPSSGYAPYYQWGRKDPIMPNISTTYGEITSFSQYVVSSGTYIANYKWSIQKPGHLMQSKNGVTTFWGGSNQYAYNLWNSRNDTTTGTSSVNKTIFDPSPAGYTVPHKNSSFTIIDAYKQGYRKTRTDQAQIWNNEGNLLGTVTDTGKKYLWTSDPDSKAGQAWGIMDGSMHSNSPIQNAMCILPINDTSYDPTDNGVLGSGTGPNINWQN